MSRPAGVGPALKCRQCDRPLKEIRRDTWVRGTRVKGQVVGYGYIDRGRPTGLFCSLRCGFRWAVATLRAQELS